MHDTNKSDSTIQRLAENSIFALIKAKLGEDLEQGKRLYLPDHTHSYIQPDFYSERACILGEIFAHVGKPKKAQNNKIANDILKMLTYEELTHITFRKIIAVCDPEEYTALQGHSVLAEAIRTFGIQLMYIPISEELYDQLQSAQKRQKMVNW